ncbi:uncharacterized protein LOC115814867 isoform X2 [Chanos chanos]|uniref:Uncharacterized protein LOC115814867 isoform X2 n=1 Tax=Chanos chanos TaxID=29144 RepID=A0A6J2VNQ9_CHACN|nr:uncharacterized protein LOC115814867 isoform X2 [Chanos chanos]
MASYRSPAARLSAIESFRYFRKLDHMLTPKPRAGGQQEGGSGGGHGRVMQSPSDLEDHTDSDVAQSCTRGPLYDTIIPKLEGDIEEKLSPGVASTDAANWDAAGDEVVTLGLSGEYLYSVKTESQGMPFSHSFESAREVNSCSSEDFQAATCEDTTSLILQQLTILNHQLSEQLAEQRAFHCSMLGMMDRQIEVLEQLSNFTRAHQPKPDANETDSVISQKVHDTLLQILKRMDQSQAQAKTLQPCTAKSSPSESVPPPPPPSWRVSLLEVHQRSPSTEGNSSSETEPSQPTDTSSPIKTPPSEELPQSPKKDGLVNGLSSDFQHK